MLLWAWACKYVFATLLSILLDTYTHKWNGWIQSQDLLKSLLSCKVWYNIYYKSNEVMNLEAMIRSWPVSEEGADTHSFPLCSQGESAARSQQQADWTTHTFYSRSEPTEAPMLSWIDPPTVRTGCKNYRISRFPPSFSLWSSGVPKHCFIQNHKGQHKFWRIERRVKAGSLKLQVTWKLVIFGDFKASNKWKDLETLVSSVPKQNSQAVRQNQLVQHSTGRVGIGGKGGGRGGWWLSKVSPHCLRALQQKQMQGL